MTPLETGPTTHHQSMAHLENSINKLHLAVNEQSKHFADTIRYLTDNEDEDEEGSEYSSATFPPRRPVSARTSNPAPHVSATPLSPPTFPRP